MQPKRKVGTVEVVVRADDLPVCDKVGRLAFASKGLYSKACVASSLMKQIYVAMVSAMISIWIYLKNPPVDL